MDFKDYFLKLYIGVGVCPSADTYPSVDNEPILDLDALSVMFTGILHNIQKLLLLIIS